LEAKVDEGRKFLGVEEVGDAIEYMYQGKNIGKVVVEFPDHIQSKL
jgi:NADPH-dependent curcumin reductase CurA